MQQPLYPGMEQDMEISLFMIQNVVPDVMYRDWEDFVRCVYETQTRFDHLIEKSVEHECNMQSSKKSRFACSLANDDSPVLPFFTGDCFDMILDRGSSVMTNITKGQECAFTQLIAKNLYNQCMRVASSYSDMIYYYQCYQQDINPANRNSCIRFDYKHLCDLMKNNIHFAFSGLMPVNICFHKCGFIAALMSKNFCIFDSESKHTMSVSQYQTFLLTLTQGLHERLGSDSPLLTLNVDLLRKITSALVLPLDMALTECATRELWLY